MKTQIEDLRTSRCRIADPREVWEHVLPGLKLLHQSSELQDWDIDSIRQKLENDDWLLIIDDTDPTCFAIVRLDDSPYITGDMELFVFLAYHRGQDAIPRFQPHIESMARTGGAKHIRFYSQRRGMLRLATRAGYAPRSVEYIKEL